MAVHLPPAALFSDLLSRPLHTPLPWKSRRPRADELSLAEGVHLCTDRLPFSGDGVKTALEDFRAFLSCQCILITKSGVPVRFHKLTGSTKGRWRVTVSHREIIVSADSPEGIRRGVIWMEDEMQGREGPFLPLGKQEAREVISTRISRCFYGPIQRPPLNQNELADDINYYPGGYLNRLAHDGVTALWITVKFSESVPSTLFPEYGRHADSHLAKLRATVERCQRYGIKIYVFCIEPAALAIDSPILAQHPELRGAQVGNLASFCTQSKLGRRYVEEATATLFKAVPGLGGLIVIPVGERLTHCASTRLDTLESCPRCAKIGRNKVLHDVLEGFRNGMDKAAPDAELIAWPYGQMICWGAEKTVEAADHIPPGIILQHNYETGGVATQLGKPRLLWDYWLSWTGVSPVFEKAARRVLARKGRMAAKLQVGNSHENATVPFLPVPGLLYQKYQAMHRLGVSAAMQSWYFGNYPSLMTRAAGLLSYAPLPATEGDFLHQLARKEWGSQAARVAKAWSSFGRGYSHYPATHFFSYYGPVQSGVTWLLYLKPRREPLSPTWKMDFPPSGDYLPHCFSHFFTLRELITLCSRMVRHWKLGCRHLEKAYTASAHTSAQTHEYQIAQAICLQFENALAILRFYAYREKLADTESPVLRLELLDEMEKIVREELNRRRQFLPLLRLEPTLGYHSEAEGFKITAELVEASIQQLHILLKEEFPEVRGKAKAAMGDWFGAYTGRNPGSTPALSLRRCRLAEPEPSDWASAERHPVRYWLFEDSKKAVESEGTKQGTPSRVLPLSVHFRMLASQGKLVFFVELATDDESLLKSWVPSIVLEVEAARMQPRVMFILEESGVCRGYYEDGYLQPNPNFSGGWQPRENGRDATLSIPTAFLAPTRARKPFRINLKLLFFNHEEGEYRELSWIQRHPMPVRLAWGDTNPATDYGWVLPVI